MKAMVLAAGLGTRLLPYSAQRPKPLFPVLNIPLLHRTVTDLQAAGFSEVAVNCHHLAGQIKTAMADRAGVTLFAEEEVLGTGGGLRNAMSWLGREPVLVVNGDIFHTLDYAALYEAHLQSGGPASLVLHDFPRFNKVSVDERGTIIDFAPYARAARLLAFTGIHIIEPQLLEIIPPASFYDIINCYRHWLRRGMQIRALVAEDHFWSDMGTPADYLALHGRLLTDPRFGAASSFCLAPDLDLPEVELHDWAAVGPGARIGAGACLTRVVVWPGARVAPDSRLQDTIIV
ncbi:MAG: nucleotidyl transferase [Desulfobulbaceae bacterium]|nr:MAG: nucleotidyl transferase [Desulfobulbaceae bacterium]